MSSLEQQVKQKDLEIQNLLDKQLQFDKKYFNLQQKVTEYQSGIQALQTKNEELQRGKLGASEVLYENEKVQNLELKYRVDQLERSLD